MSVETTFFDCQEAAQGARDGVPAAASGIFHYIRNN